MSPSSPAALVLEYSMEGFVCPLLPFTQTVFIVGPCLLHFLELLGIHWVGGPQPSTWDSE